MFLTASPETTFPRFYHYWTPCILYLPCCELLCSLSYLMSVLGRHCGFGSYKMFSRILHFSYSRPNSFALAGRRTCILSRCFPIMISIIRKTSIFTSHEAFSPACRRGHPRLFRSKPSHCPPPTHRRWNRKKSSHDCEESRADSNSNNIFLPYAYGPNRRWWRTVRHPSRADVPDPVKDSILCW